MEKIHFVVKLSIIMLKLLNNMNYLSNIILDVRDNFIKKLNKIAKNKLCQFKY